MNPASRNDTGAAQDPRLLDVNLYEDNALHRIGVNEGEQQIMIWALPKIVACKSLQGQCTAQNLEKVWTRSEYAVDTEVPTSGAWRKARCEKYSHLTREMPAHVKSTCRFAHAVPPHVPRLSAVDYFDGCDFRLRYGDDFCMMSRAWSKRLCPMRTLSLI